MSTNSFGARDRLDVGGQSFDYYRLEALTDLGDIARLPYSLKVLLENQLRHEDGDTVTAEDIEALAAWDPTAEATREIAFRPARVLMQDFTGVPAIVDIASMRDAMAELGGDPSRINPLVPVDLVVDHSVIADIARTADAYERNVAFEFERNGERYAFLRWGQQAFDGLRVVPPNTGIVHQVNVEYLATVITGRDGQAFPDTLVGTDSHTPMVNGLGVLGWGVGGIEAEAAMLGQPVSMLIPDVVGFELVGELPEGATATDLVLTITERLREFGVVGKFVEFFGPGVARIPTANRATIGNMSPEYGSTCTMFPIDEETLRYLRLTGRSEEQIALVEAYAKAQGMWHDVTVVPTYSQTLTLDLGEVVPSLAGPARPQDRVPVTAAKASFRTSLNDWLGVSHHEHAEEQQPGVPDQDLPEDIEPDSPEAASALSFPASDAPASMAGQDNGHSHGAEHTHHAPPAQVPDRRSRAVPVTLADGTTFDLDDGHVVIAAITSCTNTSNPQVMLAAALLARNAVERGLTSKPWVKTSLAPGSKVVMDYYEAAGLIPYLEKLGFYLVGYGCTTCIGNSGPLAPEISEAVAAADLSVCSVLSGNRNFEGRINPDVRMNYLASPPLVVAYAIAGSLDIDLTTEPLGTDSDGNPVYLKDIWPRTAEIQATIEEVLDPSMFTSRYADVATGDERWLSLATPSGDRYTWDESSTYIRQAPFVMVGREPEPVADVRGARALAVLGDSTTTDHISPAGVIKADGPAGRYLTEHGVERKDFNSFGARRGNHEVMIRGTFSNIRLRNHLVDVEGGYTLHLPDGEELSIYDAAMRYADEGVPLIVLAGKEYGSGSSRDWAAKGTLMLGVRAVIAESYERIHRSNLIGMGVVPLQFKPGDSVASLGLSGHETFEIVGLADRLSPGSTVTVTADDRSFEVDVRIDTPMETRYVQHGGILPYVLRQLAD